MENNNIFAKMNVVRTELSKYLKKGGKNNYSNYSYFQLDDFIPTLLQLCNDNGLFTQFWIGRDKVDMPTETVEVTTTDSDGNTITTKTVKENFQYAEFAHLVIYDVESQDTMEFTKETANCSLSGAQPIQNLGSKTTYMKRYMYMDAFEIVENDKIEEETGKPEPKVEKKTTKTSKPKVEAVATQPVYTEAPTVEAMYEANVQGTWVPQNEPVIAPVETTIQPTIEASVEVQTEALMSMETKMELANMFKEAGLDPRTTIAEFTQALGVQDVPFLKESDKERIIELFNKKIGG
jgi:hypothetical protein